MSLQRHVIFVIGGALTAIMSFHVVLVGSLAQPGGATLLQAPAPADARERVSVTPAERDAIRGEMRTMLHSLSGIMQGMIAGDLQMAQQAARASGTRTLLDTSLQKKLPPDFRQLSMRTHKRFEELADTIKTGTARDTVLKRLAAIMASCVTCHDTYRLDQTRE